MRTAFLLAAALLLAGPALAQKYPADFPVDTTISGNENIHHQENHSGSYTSYNLPFRFVKRYMSPNVAASPIGFYPDTAGIGTKYNYLGKFVTAPDSSAWYIDGTGQAMYLGIPALSFSNGLTNNGPMVGLGGMLEEPTYIYVTPGSPLVLQDTSGVASAIFGSNAVSLFSEKGDTVAYMSAFDGKVDMHGGEDAQVGIQVSENQMEAWDDRGTKRGLQYRADYSSDLKASPRSIPDVGTVQELIADSLNILWDSIALLNMQLEASADSISKLQLAMGIPAGASSLGSFDGETIPDGSSCKEAVQALETAIEQGGGGDERYSNTDGHYVFFDDFDSNPHATAYGEKAWTLSSGNGGSGSRVNAGPPGSIPNAMFYGLPNLSTGNSSSTGYAYLSTTSAGYYYGAQDFHLKTKVLLNTDLDVTPFACQVGYYEGGNTTTPSHGFYFNIGYNRSGGTTVDSIYGVFVSAASGLKQVNLGVDPEIGEYVLEIYYDHTAQTCQYLVNGVLKGTLTGCNYPTGTSAATTPVIYLRKHTATGFAFVFIDYYMLDISLDRMP